MIDPYSVKYWEAGKPSKPSLKDTFVQPHRPALAEKTAKMNAMAPNGPTSAPQAFKVQRQIPPQDMDAFRAAIGGQDMTKIAMIEHLKKL
jgi:chromatin assembly factor 1 subunit A